MTRFFLVYFYPYVRSIQNDCHRYGHDDSNARIKLPEMYNNTYLEYLHAYNMSSDIKLSNNNKMPTTPIVRSKSMAGIWYHCVAVAVN